jgi:hypothetical protein
MLFNRQFQLFDYLFGNNVLTATPIENNVTYLPTTKNSYLKDIMPPQIFLLRAWCCHYSSYHQRLSFYWVNINILFRIIRDIISRLLIELLLPLQVLLGSPTAVENHMKCPLSPHAKHCTCDPEPALVDTGPELLCAPYLTTCRFHFCQYWQYLYPLSGLFIILVSRPIF